VDISGENPPGWTFVGNAEAIIGMPFTPLSYAGVARRTTRRVVYADTAVAASTAAAATASAVAYNPPPPPPQQPPVQASGGVPVGTVVQSLPGGCKSVTVSDTEYHDCGNSFYKTAFQGNNLVYVVVQNPM